VTEHCGLKNRTTAGASTLLLQDDLTCFIKKIVEHSEGFVVQYSIT
jgi:hypothetical protein